MVVDELSVLLLQLEEDDQVEEEDQVEDVVGATQTEVEVDQVVVGGV